MNNDPYRQVAKRTVIKHKVISVSYTNTGWKRQLELELDVLTAQGWRPFLYGDAGNQATIILERTQEEE